jgi:hypothetical protein
MRSNEVFDLRLGAGLAAAAPAQQMGIPASSSARHGARRGHRSKPQRPDPARADVHRRHGTAVRLGQYFRQKPVVLALVYYECPGLCDMILNGLTHSMEQGPLNVGSDFDVVTVSFNPKETWQLATAKKANYVEKYQRKGAVEGWHFLTGKEEMPSRNSPTPWDSTTNTIPSASSSPTPAPSWCSRPKARSRATSTGSSTNRATFAWAWWKRPPTRSETRRRPGSAVLLSLRSHHREIWNPVITERYPSAGFGHRAGARRIDLVHAPAGAARGSPPGGPPNLMQLPLCFQKPLPRSPPKSIICTST